MALTLQFDFPPQIEAAVRDRTTDLTGDAKEAWMVSLYRQGKLTIKEFRESLGLTRMDAERVLHRHKVTEDLGTLEDYLNDIETLSKLTD